MDDIFLALIVLFSVGMMVLMVKYAKFIHKQPRIEAERRQNIKKDNPPSDEQN